MADSETCCWLLLLLSTLAVSFLPVAAGEACWSFLLLHPEAVVPQRRCAVAVVAVVVVALQTCALAVAAVQGCGCLRVLRLAEVAVVEETTCFLLTVNE